MDGLSTLIRGPRVCSERFLIFVCGYWITLWARVLEHVEMTVRSRFPLHSLLDLTDHELSPEGTDHSTACGKLAPYIGIF